MMKARSGVKRLVAAAGALIAVAALLTAAVITDTAEHKVSLDGSRNSFDLVVAGSFDMKWTPKATDWEQGNPTAYELRVAEADKLLQPGDTLDVRIAAKNASPWLAGSVNLSILDPNPLGAVKDPATGNYMELFDQLTFTVRDGNKVIFDHVPAAALTTYTWDKPVAAGDYLLLDVRIELSKSLGREYQCATTDVQFHFEAENV